MEKNGVKVIKLTPKIRKGFKVWSSEFGVGKVIFVASFAGYIHVQFDDGEIRQYNFLGKEAVPGRGYKRSITLYGLIQKKIEKTKCPYYCEPEPGQHVISQNCLGWCFEEDYKNCETYLAYSWLEAITINGDLYNETLSVL